MPLFKSLKDSLLAHADRNAFCISNVFYTYRELSEKVSAIRGLLAEIPDRPANPPGPAGAGSAPGNNTGTGSHIGLVTNDDLETYAAMIAIWLEGRSYTPISPQTPAARNEEMIRQAHIGLILDSSEQAPGSPDSPDTPDAPERAPDFPAPSSNPRAQPPHSPEQASFPNVRVIDSRQQPAFATKKGLDPKTVPDTEPAYILFTSGSTGIPKGVPITRGNLAAFIRAFSALELPIGEQDRCLQMFELGFDLSVMAWLVPLLNGACVYTIPKNQIKYQYISRILEEHRLTCALMIPSVLHYLQPYFGEMHYPDLRICLFCGEALSLDLAGRWSQCVPNAKILNVYGPTEATIFCTQYPYDPAGPHKSQNGVLSIGKPMKDIRTLIVSPDPIVSPGSFTPLGPGLIGELCLAGPQLTPGYLGDDAKNRSSFFYIAVDGKQERFYRTGDLCLTDGEGDILYIGRMDAQVKIQGYRVELPEIEFHARAFLPAANIVALAFASQPGKLEAGLIIEGEESDTRALTDFLKTRLPAYMIPARIRFEKTFPLNNNGKTDRNELLNRFQQQP